MRIIGILGKDNAAWHIVDGNTQIRAFETSALNPVNSTSIEPSKILSLEVMDKLPQEIATVILYCTEMDQRGRISLEEALIQHFDCPIEIHDYHQGLACSICGSTQGVVAVVEETSTACLYNGQSITHTIPSLGYIHGDHGSSTVLGARFISALLSHRLPTDLSESFYRNYGVNHGFLMANVKKEPLSPEFLHTIAWKFIFPHREDPAIESLIRTSCVDFLSHSVLPLTDTLPVHFIGEMTSFYGSTLYSICHNLGINIGTVSSNAKDLLLSSYVNHVV